MKKDKIKDARITMLINPDYTEITIEDTGANISIVKVKLTPIQLSAILSRQGYVECECVVGDLSKVGTIMENQSFEFEYNKADGYKAIDNKALAAACDKALIENGLTEWISDNYYGSQNSFFQKDGKSFARTTIRRWVHRQG